MTALQNAYKLLKKNTNLTNPGLACADQPAEILRSSRAASCVRSENSGTVQVTVNSVDLTQDPSAVVTVETTRSTRSSVSFGRPRNRKHDASRSPVRTHAVWYPTSTSMKNEGNFSLVHDAGPGRHSFYY
jgi:hypothetical protein